MESKKPDTKFMEDLYAKAEAESRKPLVEQWINSVRQSMAAKSFPKGVSIRVEGKPDPNLLAEFTTTKYVPVYSPSEIQSLDRKRLGLPPHYTITLHRRDEFESSPERSRSRSPKRMNPSKEDTWFNRLQTL